MAVRLRPGDNGAVKASRPAWVIDTAIAVVATLAAVPAGPSAWVVLGIALTAAPLAFRRRYPATAFGVIFAAVLVTHDQVTTITFGAVIFAAYSAVLYSRFR